MLDIKFIRENKDIVAAGAKKKHIKIDIDALIALDDKRRALQLEIDQKRAEQNVASDKIARLIRRREKEPSSCRCRRSKKISRCRKSRRRKY